MTCKLCLEISILDILVTLSDFLNESEDILQHIDIILVKEVVVVLRTWIAFLSICVLYALLASLSQMLKLAEAVTADLDLVAHAPHGQVESCLDLIRAEGLSIGFKFEEGAVVTVGQHVLFLFVKVELMGYDV